MKFGKQLLLQRIGGWEEFYVDYATLKAFIKDASSGDGAFAAARIVTSRCSGT
jgi:SPX domain protein involved in polyphosphate accumulation